jgi:hypothetical protein
MGGPLSLSAAAIMAVFKPTPRVLKSTGASPYFFYIIYFQLLPELIFLFLF